MSKEWMPLIGDGALRYKEHYVACDDIAGPIPTKYAEDHPVPVYNCMPHTAMQEIWTWLFKCMCIMSIEPVQQHACVQDGR